MDPKDNIEELYRKFLDDEASPEEVDILLTYFSQSRAEDIRLLIRVELANTIDPNEEPNIAGLYNNIQARIQPVEVAPVRRLYSKPWLRYAAAVFLFFSVGIYWYTTRQQQQTDTLITQLTEDVPPGGNKAMITFSNGKQMLLDSTQSHLRTVDGKYVYADGQELEPGAVEFATVSTPVGGTYAITLPDGTKAWLNAASSIRYPSRFTGQERQIVTTGEVFLDVAHDKTRPFIVNSNGQRIQVLGTAFNLRSYTETTITTLVRGRIALTSLTEKSLVTLKPGQQAISSGRDIQVLTVDPADYIAWTEGMILDKDASLFEICQELERWYDVRFIFPQRFNNKERALVNVDRREHLSTVLRALEKAYLVQFDIKGKEVRVN